VTSKLRNIAVSVTNYERLKSLGKAGDSFNDVLTELLKKRMEER
jgi:predicted CopG family antitoxin